MIKNRYYSFLRKRVLKDTTNKSISFTFESQSLSNLPCNISEALSVEGHELIEGEGLKSGFHNQSEDIIINKELDFDSCMKSSSFINNNDMNFQMNFPENDNILSEDLSKFEGKHYSFPNEEPLFDEFNVSQLFDEKKMTNTCDVSNVDPGETKSELYNEGASTLEEFDAIIKGINNPSGYVTYLYSNNNINSLCKQMKQLDMISEKVSIYYNNRNSNSTARLNDNQLMAVKFEHLNQQIDERKKTIHNQIHSHSLERDKATMSVEHARKYLIKQMELIIQLVYSTKLKSKLLQTID